MPDDPFSPPSPEPGPPMNPYEPPEAELGGPAYKPYHGTLPGQPFSASVVIGRSWEIYKARFPQVFGLVIVPNAIVALYQLVGGAMGEAVDQDSVMGILGQYAFAIAGLVLQIWLTCGQTRGLIQVARDEPTGLGEIFHGGPYVLRMIGATIVYLLTLVPIVALLALPAVLLYLAGQGLAAIISGIVAVFAAVCIGLIVRVRFEQYQYLIIEREFGVMQAIRGSLAMTRGHTIDLVGLVLVGGLIGASGLLLCGVGLLLTLPWMQLLLACIYVGLSDEHPGLDPDAAAAADLEL